MPEKSAGLLVYRLRQKDTEIFLVHPGGPFWQNRDQHAWSIPKGLIGADKNQLATAYREFTEETGLDPPRGRPTEMKPCRQDGGKIIYVWAVEGNPSTEHISSNNFKLEWPPNSGEVQRFPEIDKAEWFTLSAARKKLHKYLLPVVDELEEMSSE